MKFQYSVIGDNTQENREWLEKVGYKFIPTKDYPCAFIITSTDGTFTLIRAQNVVFFNEVDYIRNPPLFKAVSAMREDSDLHQQFTNETNSMWITFSEFHKDGIEQDISEFAVKLGLHKATHTELQERFKEKER